MSVVLTRIVSGGQTGVDRAALDVAIDCGLEHGGWCPKGRRAEDGPIPARYLMQETEAVDYSVRTERNVLDSDATLILYEGSLSGGTRLTWKLAQKHQRPVLKVDLSGTNPAILIPAVNDWIEQAGIQTLNVAGPRESTRPGISRLAQRFLELLLSD